MHWRYLSYQWSRRQKKHQRPTPVSEALQEPFLPIHPKKRNSPMIEDKFKVHVSDEGGKERL